MVSESERQEIMLLNLASPYKIHGFYRDFHILSRTAYRSRRHFYNRIMPSLIYSVAPPFSTKSAGLETLLSARVGVFLFALKPGGSGNGGWGLRERRRCNMKSGCRRAAVPGSVRRRKAARSAAHGNPKGFRHGCRSPPRLSPPPPHRGGGSQ